MSLWNCANHTQSPSPDPQSGFWYSETHPSQYGTVWHQRWRVQQEYACLLSSCSRLFLRQWVPCLAVFSSVDRYQHDPVCTLEILYLGRARRGETGNLLHHKCVCRGHAHRRCRSGTARGDRLHRQGGYFWPYAFFFTTVEVLLLDRICRALHAPFRPIDDEIDRDTHGQNLLEMLWVALG